MTSDALKSLAASLAKAGAPILGGALGGPVGAAVAGTVIGALADALGVDATPEAVQAKVESDPAAAGPIVARVEAKQGAAVEELAARLADVQDARKTTVELAQAGSLIAWAPVAVSVIVLGGFAVFSYLAIRAAPGTQEREIVVWLLGSWQTLAGVAVTYWLGSSRGSAEKAETLAALAARDAAARSAPHVVAKVAGAVAGRVIGKAIDRSAHG